MVIIDGEAPCLRKPSVVDVIAFDFVWYRCGLFGCLRLMPMVLKVKVALEFGYSEEAGQSLFLKFVSATKRGGGGGAESQ